MAADHHNQSPPFSDEKQQKQQQEEEERIRIAYALPEKKQATIITPSLLSHASSRNLDLIPLSLSLPLQSQLPFHAILHKLCTPDWIQILQSFSISHPKIPIIDPPAAVNRLSLRSTMLDSVPKSIPSLATPGQFLAIDSVALSELTNHVRFPVMAKPMEANGGPGSHKMALVLRPEGLKQISTPVVLQEFVNHGGVVFKVYVVGDIHVQCEKRKSVADVSEEMVVQQQEAVVEFERISNLPVADENVERAVPPPREFVEEVAREMRKQLGLNLFNFDLIRDLRGGEDRYLVIDINYFPGYAKTLGYEKVLTDFLLDVVHKSRDRGDAAVDIGNSY